MGAEATAPNILQENSREPPLPLPTSGMEVPRGRGEERVPGPGMKRETHSSEALPVSALGLLSSLPL